MKLLHEYIKGLLAEQGSQQIYMHGTTPSAAEEIQRCNCLRPGKRGRIHAYLDDPNEEVENRDDIISWHRGRGHRESPVFVKFTTAVPPMPMRPGAIFAVWTTEELPIQILGVE